MDGGQKTEEGPPWKSNREIYQPSQKAFTIVVAKAAAENSARYALAGAILLFPHSADVGHLAASLIAQSGRRNRQLSLGFIGEPDDDSAKAALA